MAITELFIGAFIRILFEKLTSDDMIKLAQSARIYSELNRWCDSLTLIQAVLVDAGHKHIRDRSVQLWLKKLQHLAYEIDDVLDDLATEAMRHQLKNQESDASTSNNTTSKILKFIPNKFHDLKYGRKMSSKLDGITTKLIDLDKEKSLLGLNDNVERSSGASRRLEETSLVDESKVIGREGDKGKLLRKLLGGESSSSQTSNFNVVSVVGLGGIGKTTLAQLLYNDKKVKEHFELRAWVCVSNEFDVFSISKAIFQAVGGRNQDFARLNLLQEALKEKLSKKKFLLVLDDVWNENYHNWELLQRPFTTVAHGSKVLVTTRKTTVASTMDSVQSFPLKLLSDEEALSLFAQHALSKQNFDSHPALKLHGEGIVKKCGGLPLALRTVGRMLRTKTNDEEWEELLNSELWNLHDETNLFPALRLSYYDLPPHLKQMFAYCCLFPKDYMFDKDELVLLWMGEGFLYEAKNKKSMESFGQKCFEELLSRSFFMLSTIYKSRYIMHDLINDLAMNVAGEFFFRVDDKTDFDDRHKHLDKFHHLSFIREEHVAYEKFKPLQRARRLRTLLAMPVTELDWWKEFYMSNKVLIELLPQLQFLRVLSLANYNIAEVPMSIGHLKHMRYLNLSYNTRITCLPEQVGDLPNLQSLLLSGCHNLSSLPASIVKLTNLRHLDISDTWALNKMPLGLGGLTSLQTLSKVVIGEANEFKKLNLKGLVHLQGQFSIKGLHKVENTLQAKEAELQHKKGICNLELEWSDIFDDSRNKATESEVLEGLRPFEKLSNLKILYYGGREFPSWVGDPSFVFLTHLTLRGCKSCKCLPALGHLPSLQALFVESMDALERLGFEFLGHFNSCHDIAFPSLVFLKFKDMTSWEEWSTIGGDIAVTFPCLHEISMINCGKLNEVAIKSIPSLQELHVEGCSEVLLKNMIGVSSSIVRLSMKNIGGLTQLCEEVLENLEKVEHLSISECDELTYMWESEVVACTILLSCKNLVVDKCKNLVSLGKNEVQSITKVVIEHCERLESYNCPNSIEKLKIRFCHSLTSLIFPKSDDIPSPLKFLNIMGCYNVEVSWLVNNFLSSLEDLYISNMMNLRLFPKGCLVHLTTLVIDSCDNIESIPNNGYGFLPSCCLRYLMISNCKNLKSFPHEHLQRFESLEKIIIFGCPNLDYSFPCGLWPPNLSFLRIGELKKPISEWGVQNFPTSLVGLFLNGCNDSGMVRFAKAEEEDTSSSSSFLLPSSLNSLYLSDFKELESLSDGLQHLTSLQHLDIHGCKKLKDLPKTLFSSLLSLRVDSDCSLKLRNKCSKSKKGKYWPIISQIPDLQID